ALLSRSPAADAPSRGPRRSPTAEAPLPRTTGLRATEAPLTALSAGSGPTGRPRRFGRAHTASGTIATRDTGGQTRSTTRRTDLVACSAAVEAPVAQGIEHRPPEA